MTLVNENTRTTHNTYTYPTELSKGVVRAASENTLVQVWIETKLSGIVQQCFVFKLDGPDFLEYAPRSRKFGLLSHI